ncbi:PREDICTED: putative defensin-like protein 303 [Camelina sativa]|uniref:Defensin-like protein 303 n=1 Tax=Camelina sativa TaxID=90675 RepID=A0ABM1QJX4_CAMSA|nr:PREDICTED: putative defensin-like protein 303 [Camelina sativa]
MNSNKTTFFLALFLVSALCIQMIESRDCYTNDDCKGVQPCPVPLACVFGNCICPWKNQSKLSSTCQIICARLEKKAINSYDASPCVCIDK